MDFSKKQKAAILKAKEVLHDPKQKPIRTKRVRASELNTASEFISNNHYIQSILAKKFNIDR
ncbi:hypothetical protein [Peribacillus glennii]|uniref:Uncharacterized protein n=1 Tax=Peribacillus glennii TaxID=2303991 RepID=A0A372L7A6_9BACI|nr:hypothetical protein [Peribacillus glennii]RFU61104.1 hypothetical protein D0466_19155 [Peribacillus glennii]